MILLADAGMHATERMTQRNDSALKLRHHKMDECGPDRNHDTGGRANNRRAHNRDPPHVRIEAPFAKAREMSNRRESEHLRDQEQYSRNGYGDGEHYPPPPEGEKPPTEAYPREG